jgi:hypothetical protein
MVDALTLGPWRRRRWMARQLRDLDRLDAVDTLDGWHVPAPPRLARRGGRVLRRAATGTAVVALVCFGTAMFLRQEYGIVVSLDGLTGPQRLTDPAAGPVGGGSHAFAQEDRGEPVRYSPCEPVELVVNDSLEPAGAAGLVAEAADRVSAATGLVVTVVGTTDEEPEGDRLVRQPHRYGAGFAPVLVAWTTPEQEPRLTGNIAGIGGSAAVADDAWDHPRFVTGSVSLDAPDLTETLSRPNGRDLVRAVVMHELAHVVGLDHVDDPRELMYQDNVGVLDFGPGDLTGLAVLGSGPCR